MIKNFFTLLLITSLVFSCTTTTEKNKEAYLSFTIKNYKRNTIELSEISDLTPLYTNTNQIQLKKDKDSRFTITLKVTDATYFKVARNNLYISPGDSIVASLDYNDDSKAIFKGIGYEASKYLSNLPYPKAGSYLWAGREIKSTIDSTIINIKQLAKKRESTLSEVKNVSSEFKTLETARIKADLINSYQSLFSYYPYIKRVPKDQLNQVNSRLKEATEAEVNKLSKEFLIPSFLQLSTYQQIVSLLLKNNVDESLNKKQLQDWQRATTMAYKLKSFDSNEELATYFKQNLSTISTKRYKTQLQNVYKEYSSFGKGSIAKNFTAITTKGFSESLEKYKGKLIYIDIWATWCVPCLKEMPSFNKLVNKYATNKNVVFISLSVDNNLQEWKKNLLSRENKGIQLNTSFANLGAYKVNGIPRIIIINKDFKIVAFKGPKPSSKETIKLIEDNL